jgi:predicted nucleotidyltransferase component of viral defense system
VDANRRPEIVEARRELVSSEHGDMQPLGATVLTAGHGLAEKVRVLLVRGKPRDLYDIWLLPNQGVSPDRALIGRKLEFYQTTFSAQVLEAAIARVRASWEHDLRPLLPQFGPIGDNIQLAATAST